MTTADSTLSIKEIQRHISYSPTSGKFVRRITAGCSKAGNEIGKPTTNGYIEIWVLQKRFYAHRLAWLLSFGELPKGCIDHINGDKADNSLANLRDVPRSVNNQNQRAAHRDNANLLGVRKRKTCWSAAIKVGKKQEYLGSYATEIEAHTAYVRRKRELHEGCTI